MSDYDTRLDQELQSILRAQRAAALGSLGEDGAPFVSLVPFAVEPVTGRVVLQVGALAPHTPNMHRDVRVSLLVTSPEPGIDEAARARVTLVGEARFPVAGSEEWQACRLAYLARFPETHAMASMLDLSLVSITVKQVRQVSGFGAARSLPGDVLSSVPSRIAA
jgi:putative heme iron utilization protein